MRKRKLESKESNQKQKPTKKIRLTSQDVSLTIANSLANLSILELCGTHNRFRLALKRVYNLFFGSPVSVSAFLREAENKALQRIEIRNLRLLSPEIELPSYPKNFRFQTGMNIFTSKYFSRHNMHLQHKIHNEIGSLLQVKELLQIISGYLCEWVANQQQWKPYEESYIKFLKATNPQLHRYFLLLL